MLFSRRTDDADVIRARLRALLDEGAGHRGWLPDDHDRLDTATAPEPWEEDDEDPDSWSLGPDGTTGTPVAGPPLAEQPRPARPDVGGGRHRASGPATRVDPGPHGTRALWVVALVAALAVAGWSWLSRPEVSPVDAVAPAVPAASTGSPAGAGATEGATGTDGATADDPSATSAAGQIVVAVVGQVVDPGVVTLSAGARVADALAAAGGLLPEADPASVNAAALLSDGQQVAVGVPGAAGAPTGSGTSGTGGGGLVDLNTAGAADLDALPGIGPVLAQRIVDHRTEQGPFTSVQQLDDVSGIGPSLYAEIAPLVTV